jgi:hypothetical protein
LRYIFKFRPKFDRRNREFYNKTLGYKIKEWDLAREGPKKKGAKSLPKSISEPKMSYKDFMHEYNKNKENRRPPGGSGPKKEIKKETKKEIKKEKD